MDILELVKNYKEPESNKTEKRMLPCEGHKSWTDFGYEYDCGYGGEVTCEDCVCAGGEYDPRYPYSKQPKPLSKYVLYTRDVNIQRMKKECEKEGI